MRNQEVVYNLLGQSFFYDPPERFRPSGTPTVTVYWAGNDDDQQSESATTGSCSVDSVDTTLGAAATAGDTTIAVASGTAISRGRRYLLTGIDGDCELLDVLAVTGTTVRVRQPIVNSYAITTSTFQGTRISIAVSSSWVADRNKITDFLYANRDIGMESVVDESPGAAGYRLRWSYTAGGVSTIGVSFADLVRYQAKNLVTPLDVDRRFAGWIDRLGPDDREDQGSALIDEAFYAVKLDAMGDAQVIRRIRNTEVLRELVAFRANLIQQENAVLAGRQDTSGVDAARKLYGERYDRLLREPKIPVDQGGNGASSQAVRLPAWRR